MHGGDSKSSPDGSGDGGANSELLRYVCENCVTALEEAYDFCPQCDHPRPTDGWRKTRDYPDTWLGRTIRHYRIERRLGKGTFGSVYLGRRRHLADAYAIKIINTRDATLPDSGPSIQERVQREVRILSSLSTPHIVDFHDFIELPGGALAVVMDYVQGDTLAEILSGERKFSIDRALQFAIELATALFRAHERGAVHRDLKPDNVMVRNMEGAREFVQLIDFGVARFEHEVSETVGFIGTPRYTSPEQARGESADHRSDIYSLGMLLFHMLAGRPPFTGNDVNGLLQAHSTREPPTLAETVPERHIPRGLDDLLQEMMSKSPDDRPGNMQIVADRLRTIQSRYDDEPTSEGLLENDSRPDTDTRNASPFGALHRTDDHPSLDEQTQPAAVGRTDQLPTDLYDVAPDGRIVYCDETDRLRARPPGGSDEDDELLSSRLDTPVTALAADRDERLLIGQSDGTIRALDPSLGRIEKIRRDAAGSPVTAVAETPDGSCIVAGYRSGRVEFCDRREQNHWRPLPADEPVSAVAIYHDGSCIAIGRDGGVTDVYAPARSIHERCTRISHETDPEHLAFSPDGYLIAIQLAEETRLFAALTGTPLGESTSSLLEPSDVFEEATE